jgi:dolichol kinase
MLYFILKINLFISMNVNNQSKYEIYRKLIHLSSVAFSFIYICINKNQILLILVISSIIFVLSDYFRRSNNIVNKFFILLFGNALRLEEKNNTKLTSASLMLIAFSITALLFSKFIVIISWLILSISDTIASLGGRKFGVQTKYGKSIIGSIFFLTTSIIIAIAVKKYFANYLDARGLIYACFITCIAEFFSNSLKIDDNFLVPIVFCSSYNIILIAII